MRTSEIRDVFAVLASELPALVAEQATDEEDAFMDGPFPIAAQDALSRELVEAFGATWDQFRLDPTVHPFEVTFGLGDIRLTTRYAENELTSLFTAMHEQVTASTSGASRRPSSERRSPPESRPRCTSRRAGCGRTSSAARFRSGAGSTRASRTRSPGSSRTSRSSSSIARSTVYAARASASTPTRRATGSMSSSASSSRRSCSRAGWPSPTSPKRGTPASRS